MPGYLDEIEHLWLEHLPAAEHRPFTQGGNSRSGIGLSISRRAVEANGGKLRVRNQDDKGCVFTIDLPQSGPN
ncbi:MAG: hypothetical protein H0T46_02360 [Deltaproteobacteria bacterium]|nr:hypothetical protein [Deltaproteobacteria bacterium]